MVPGNGPKTLGLSRNARQGPVSRNSRYPSGPGEYFFELIYLSDNGNYWRKLSEMLHEIIKIKI